MKLAITVHDIHKSYFRIDKVHKPPIYLLMTSSCLIDSDVIACNIESAIQQLNKHLDNIHTYCN